MQKLIISLMIIFSSTIYADDAEKYALKMQKEISDNISSGYVKCAAYFTIISKTLTKIGKKGENLGNASDAAIEWALLTGGVGRTSEMTEKVVRSRFDVYTKSMIRDDMDSDFSNTSILLSKYNDRCMWIMQNKEEYWLEWKDRIFQEQSLPLAEKYK